MHYRKNVSLYEGSNNIWILTVPKQKLIKKTSIKIWAAAFG